MPTPAQAAEGYYAQIRPAPQVLNSLLHRNGLAQMAASRMRASSLLLSDGTGANLVGATLDAYAYDQVNGWHFGFYMDPAGPPWVLCTYTRGITYWAAPISCNMLVSAADRLDADGDNTGRIMVLSHLAAGGAQVRHADALGVWSAPGAGWAAGQQWYAIACDRATSGAANALWLVGDRPGGAAASLAGSNVAPPGLPTWAAVIYGGVAGEDVMGIWHSLHPAGALGPSDPGNPTWLVVSQNRAWRSGDGAAWNNAAHGLAGTFDRRSAAYSRTTQRWVITLGNIAGDVAYSDDNGATWVLIAGALANAAGGAAVDLVCDGYGTFIAQDGNTFWVSSDEGMTWECCGYPYLPLAQVVLGYGSDATLNIDDHPVYPEVCYHLMHSGAVFSPWRSLGD